MKNFLICALMLSLVSCEQANANLAKHLDATKQKTNLNEIVLNLESNDEQEKIGDVSMSGSAAPVEQPAQIMGEDASPLESSLEQQQYRKPDTYNGFFNIFNLKGGVEKTNAEQTLENTSEPVTKAEAEKTIVKQWLDGNYATGKWFGARPLIEEHGVTINSSLLYSPFMKTGGGFNGETSTKGYSLYNLSVTVDTEKAGLWKGGTFYTLYQKKTGYGMAGSAGAMGDWMQYDGWEGRQVNQISECWYQQKLFKDKLRLKFGKQDANIDFGFLNSGWNFLNLAFSVNPTTPMPTYPDPALIGFMAEINPKEWLSIRNGIYSRYSNPFNITEVEVKTKIKKMSGRYMAGAWEMSDTTGMGVAVSTDANGIVSNYYNRNFGCYVGFEQMVYKEKKNDDNDMQGLVVFGQAGMSPSNKNDMSKYLGGGINYVGAIPKRDKDIIGIGVANGSFASRLAPLTSQVGSETAIECFYRAQITPWFYLQPDIQYIMNPSGTYANSVAIGLRTVITF